MKWIHKRKKHIYLLIVGVFILGTFAGFGNYFLDSSPLDAALTIGGRKISAKRFQAITQRVLENRRTSSPEPLTDAERNHLKQQVVQTLVQESVFLDEADRYGVIVTDAELAQMIQSVPQFQTEGRFDALRYQQALAKMRVSIRDFEDDQRRQVRIQKAQFVMASGVKISPLEFDHRFREALARAKSEERKSLLENPNGFRDQLRQHEIQATLQEWYAVVSTQMKVRVQADKLEG